MKDPKPAQGGGGSGAAPAYQVEIAAASAQAAAPPAGRPNYASVVVPQMPPGWTQHTDPATNRHYYYNSTNGATSWSHPALT